MEALEKWALRVWVGAGVWTLLAFAFNRLTIVILFFLAVSVIGFPVFWVLQQLATWFLYLTAAAIIYLPLRRISRPVAMVAALSIVTAAGILLPTLANRELGRRLDALVAEDRGGPVLIPPGRRVAYLYNWSQGFDWNAWGCENDCQRLLFSGVAGEVLLGDVSALRGGRGLTRYWIGPRRGACPVPRLSRAYADERDVGRGVPFPRPLLSFAYRRVVGEGRCLYESRASIDEADVVLVRQFEPDLRTDALIAGTMDARLVSLQRFERKSVYVRSNGRLREIMRRTHVAGIRLAVPLAIEPPDSFNTFNPAHWRGAGRVSRGRGQTAYLSELVANDLAVRGLNEFEE